MICFFKALEKAKDAGRKERALVRQREQTMSPANINLDLTYTVSTCLFSRSDSVLPFLKDLRKVMTVQGGKYIQEEQYSSLSNRVHV